MRETAKQATAADAGALLALADEMDRHVARLPIDAARMLRHYESKLRALASAPSADNRPFGALTDLYNIDSAGGAKGMRDAYEGAREDLLDWKGRAQRAERTLRGLGYTGIDASEAPQPAEGDGAVEPFVVKHYIGDDGPTIKGNGFDGLRIGETYGDAEDAREFIAWVNARITRPAATAVVPEGFVLVPRAAALVAANVANEWAVMFADIPGLEKYDRFQYGPAVEQMHDDMLAAAPAAPKGGVVDWSAVEDAAREFVDDYEMMGEDEQGREGSYTPNEREKMLILDAMLGLLNDDDFTAALNPEPQS